VYDILRKLCTVVASFLYLGRAQWETREIGLYTLL